MPENSSTAASSAPKKRSSTGRIILAVFLLVLVGLACFINYTETGRNIPAHVLVFMDTLFAGGTPAKEKAAADTIEGLGVMVTRERTGEGEEKKVTSIAGREKKIDRKVFEVLPDLYRLGAVNMADTDITDEQLKSIGKLRQLTTLVLGGTAVTDEGLAQLRNLDILESLHLQNTQITDAGMAHLTAIPKLKMLNISGTKITDAGMKELAKCPQLIWLLMSDASISDAGIQPFEKHPELKRLTVYNTKVTPAGVNKLTKSSPNALTVESGARSQESSPNPEPNALPPEEKKSAEPPSESKE